MSSLVLLAALPVEVAAHGRMTFPPNRNGGTLEIAGKNDNCELGPNSGGLPVKHSSCGYQNRDTASVLYPTNCNCKYMTGNLLHACPSDSKCSSRTGHEDAWLKPWAAPGQSTVWSPCGKNGGHKSESTRDSHGEAYEKPWDGRDLPPNTLVSASKWVMGQKAKVAFTITKHHGGGYQWRLCPGWSANSHPDDKCFQAHPLDFANTHTIVRWTDGKEKTFEAFGPSGSEVTPRNSQWRTIQIPTISAYKDTGSAHRSPPCDGCMNIPDPTNDIREEWPFSLVDEVYVPNNIPAGHAWLQWRWDNEMQDQVWTNCADIEIVAGGPSPQPAPSPLPTGSDIMKRGETLASGEMLLSQSGSAWLKLQNDGNLVLRDTSTDEGLWKSGTPSNDVVRFVFEQSDGSLVVRDSSGRSLWSSGALPTAATAKIQNDCNFVVRDRNDQSIWSTHTSCSQSILV